MGQKNNNKISYSFDKVLILFLWMSSLAPEQLRNVPRAEANRSPKNVKNNSCFCVYRKR